MKIPATHLSLHNVDRISVYHDNSFGTPLVLYVDGEHGRMKIALFMRDDVDDTYTKRLADAIAAVQPVVTAPDAGHAAAHDAADLHYGDAS
jgi:hypothetical protein